MRHISDVTVGVGHRRDLGVIEGLAGSIAKIGLRHDRCNDEDVREGCAHVVRAYDQASGRPLLRDCGPA